ncbi:MAG: hypothetical protein IJ525_05360 [Alphaproteobacteria bacterium]|nr:hypothetical protein [Alphaproteobacteria bacterium]
MKHFYLTISLLAILSGCCMFNKHNATGQQCLFDETICRKNVQALQDGIDNFYANGGMYIIKDMDSGETIEDTSVNFAANTVYETYFSKIKFENKTIPERLLNKYINLVKTSGKGLQQKLRDNVTAGTVRRANLKDVEVFGITATTEKDSDKIVITTFLGHLKYEGKNYAFIFVMDEPKGLKRTYGWQSAGWNIVPTAKNIIENIVK